MRKNSRNKRKQLKKYQMIYSDIGPSLSTEKLLTHEEAAREALAIDICKRFAIPEEESPVIETMTYSNKYKKILDEIYDEVQDYRPTPTSLKNFYSEAGDGAQNTRDAVTNPTMSVSQHFTTASARTTQPKI
ncbi:hypothetical protein Tco_0958676 [Tanacetum coccineum]